MIGHLPATLRWGACLTIALGLHAAGAAALIARWNDSADLVTNAPVVMIELAPVVMAPRTTTAETPPDPVESKQQIEPDPVPERPSEHTEFEPEPKSEKPIGKVDIKPEPAAELELAKLPPPKPPLEKPVDKKTEVRKKHERIASLASAPSMADRIIERAAAPMPGTAAHNSSAMPNWKLRLVAQIIRHKRYPSDAQSRGNQGTVHVAFSVDRSGGVHHARVVRSSGSGLLDRDALAWLERSQPLPPPPPEVPGRLIPLKVPLRYTLR